MAEHDVPGNARSAQEAAAETAWAMPGDVEAARLAVLRALARQPRLSQRALAETLGLSLGKTHYVLHALLEKGLVKVRNFRRSEKKLSYAYVLTPSGLAEKVRLTLRFLARKEAEFEALQRTIAALRLELREQAGSGQAITCGESDRGPTR